MKIAKDIIDILDYWVRHRKYDLLKESIKVSTEDDFYGPIVTIKIPEEELRNCFDEKVAEGMRDKYGEGY